MTNKFQLPFSPKKKILFFTTTFFIVLALVEVGLWIFVKAQGNAYVDELKEETIIPSTGISVIHFIGDIEKGKYIHYIPHPIWGYTNNTLRGDLNEKSFVFNQETKNTDPYKIVIHLYGGSFAEQTASYLKFNEKISVNESKECSIEVVSRSISGGHQPQQLAIALNDLPNMDVGINIDGLNDANANYLLDENTYFNFQSIFLDANQLSHFAEIVDELKSFKSKLSLWLKMEPVLSFSSTAKFYLNYIMLPKLGQKMLALNDIFLKHNNQYFTQKVENYKKWKKYTEVQSLALESKGIKFFNFIQPNLYVDSSKVWSSEEIKFRNEGRQENEWVGDSFDNFLSWYKNEKFSFKTKSLVDLFKSNSETLYIDKCCHLNTVGYGLIWKAIYQHIEKDLMSICKRKHGE